MAEITVTLSQDAALYIANFLNHCIEDGGESDETEKVLLVAETAILDALSKVT